ncbi:hypothetical protein BpHYR1_036459 [Brachionus plicatilis]|uniref:Uncharacterized protein n=1 Tax=Brachionus plicatilis TaxID=10195 RepID=A0A3M7R3T1_BRAPC|nr:hypothetical protein BpHYR1_036459 [Brachionus plicatilis]
MLHNYFPNYDLIFSPNSKMPDPESGSDFSFNQRMDTQDTQTKMKEKGRNEEVNFRYLINLYSCKLKQIWRKITNCYQKILRQISPKIND